MFTYRDAVAADLEEICAFVRSERELFFLFPKADYPLTPGQLASAMAHRSDCTVFESNGRIVGFANFYQWEKHRHCAVGNVIVAPHARGKGVGRHLMRTMIRIAVVRHEVKEVRVSCFNENTAGLLLYRKLGFIPYDLEERNDKQGRRIAIINMRIACDGPDAQKSLKTTAANKAAGDAPPWA